MSLGTPVIAVNNGGPLETVKHNETGYLCEEDPQQFMEAMLKIATDKSSKALGPNGIAHVKVPPALPPCPSCPLSSSPQGALHQRSDEAAAGGISARHGSPEEENVATLLPVVQVLPPSPPPHLMTASAPLIALLVAVAVCLFR
jgi:hypothetical protein